MSTNKDGTLEIGTRQTANHPELNLNFFATAGLDEHTTKFILSQMPVGVALLRDRKIIWTNAQIQSRMGYSQEEFLGKTPAFLYTDEQEYLRVGRELYDGLQNNEIRESEALHICKNGTLIQLAVHAAILDSSTSPPTHLVAFSDITKRVKDLEHLRAEKDMIRTLFKVSPAFIVAIDCKDGTVVTMNESMLDTLGYSREEVIGQKYLDIFVPENEWESLSAIFQTLVSTAKPTINENSVLAKDGRKYLVEWHGRPVPAKDSSLDYFIGVGVDITERRKTEEELILKRNVIQSTSSAIASTGPDLLLTDGNPAFEKAWGFDRPEEYLGKHVREYWAVEDQLEEIMNSLRESGTWVGQTQAIRKNGTRFDVQVVSSVIYNKGGEVVGYTSTSTDITERNRFEDALRESEEKYRGLFEKVADSTAIIEGEVFTDCNQAVLDLLGRNEKKDVIGKFPWEISPEFQPDGKPSVEKAKELIALAYREGRILFEWEHIRPDGVIVPVEVLLTKISAGDKPIIYAIWRDLTERKKAEAKLRESEDRFRRLAENAKDMIFRLTLPEWGFEYVSPASIDILGYTPEEIYNGPIPPDRYIHPDWRDFIEEEKNNALRGEVTPVYDFQIINKAGEVRWLNQRNVLIRDNNGNPIAVESIATDITARKNAEQDSIDHLNFLETLETIDRRISQSKDNEQLLETILKEVLEIFGCDRAWLAHPCDPEIAELALALEYTTPDYQLPSDKGNIIKIDKQSRRLIKEVLEHDGPIGIGPNTKSKIPVYMRRKYSIKSHLSMGLFLKGRDPWVFGIHQCSYGRNWSDREIRLFQEIGRRISDSLSNMLYLRDMRESEESFRALAENSFDVIMRFDRQKRHLYVNPTVEKQTGIPWRDFLGKTHEELGFPPDMATICEETIEQVFQSGETDRMELQLPNGIWVDWVLVPEFDEMGRVTAVITSSRDLTDRKRDEMEKIKLEEQLRQLQKMESIGMLAGGVAHDFNNMLTPILGYTEIALMDLDKKTPLYREIDEIHRAAERASALTRQLLAFGRKQVLDLRVINLNNTVNDFSRMIKRLIGEDVELAIKVDPSLGNVKADRDQVQQILMNLAVNSRDAMPEGGRLSIQTANTELDQLYCNTHPQVTPGQFVVLAVSDNGSGMSQNTIDHIFEPFFTTKARDKGSGLGLSTVYGIVSQHGGHITVYSEPGEGTTFKIFLPRVDIVERRHYTDPSLSSAGQGTETILVAEDEKMVRELACRVLEESGYKVIEASNAEEALKLVNNNDLQIQLLLSDVIMPGMNGRELYRLLAKIYPNLKVLYTSGYTDDVIAEHGVLDRGIHFLQKPFTVKGILAKVRETLDA